MSVIVAVGVLAAALVAVPTARADHVGLVVDRDPVTIPGTSASGLLVPGRGPTVSRTEALRALEDVPRGRCPCEITVHLSIPVGEHENERRYPISIAGRGYDGLLVSDRTRVPGLVSIYDIEPTVEALERGEEPPVTSRAELDVPARLEALDERLGDLDDSRMGAGLTLAALMAGFTLLAAIGRSPFFGRAALLSVPVGLATALSLSALEVTKPWTAVPLLFLVTAGGAIALARVAKGGQTHAASLLAIFPVYLAVLAVSQETSSLAVIGPRPENGGRFYGFNNQLETLVLAPALVGASLLGARLLPLVAALSVVTVGATFAGADGGGVIVLLAGFFFLWLRLRRVPLTARNLSLAGAAVLVLGLVFVGIDAALGGESHVTRSLGGGPGQLAEDVADRVGASVAGTVSSWHSAIVVGGSIPVLCWIALRGPRSAVLDALLVAVAVSLLVNDAPREVSGYGALSVLAVLFWRESKSS